MYYRKTIGFAGVGYKKIGIKIRKQHTGSNTIEMGLVGYEQNQKVIDILLTPRATDCIVTSLETQKIAG